jgi:hypothetical protein
MQLEEEIAWKQVLKGLACKTITSAGMRRQEHEVEHRIGTQSA